MYDPVKDGVPKTAERVVYTEAAPPASLTELVHCFWELRTETDLAEGFTLHAMPDAGGSLVQPKYPIGEHGFVSIVSDTEGNIIGLHSAAV